MGALGRERPRRERQRGQHRGRAARARPPVRVPPLPRGPGTRSSTTRASRSTTRPRPRWPGSAARVPARPPDSVPVIVRAPTLVVIRGRGGGRQLCASSCALAARRLEADRIVVVDRDPRCAARAHRDDARLRFDVADWSEWLDADLEGCGPGAHVVPYHWAPHLFLDWLRRQLARARCERTEGRRVAAAGHAVRGHDRRRRPGALLRDLALSADVHRARAVPAHARAQDWSLAADLEAPRGDERFDGHVVFRCLHLVYGIGTTPVAEILGARDRLVAGPRRGTTHVSRLDVEATVTAWPRPDDRVRRFPSHRGDDLGGHRLPGRPTQVACMGGRAMERRALFGSMLSAAAGARCQACASRAPLRARRRVRRRARAPVPRRGRRHEPLLQDWERPAARCSSPAWGLNADAWMYETTYLAGQGLRCVAYDRRGHGSLEPARPRLRLRHAGRRPVGAARDPGPARGDAGRALHGLREVVRYIVRYGGSRVARGRAGGRRDALHGERRTNLDGVDRGVLEAGARCCAATSRHGGRGRPRLLQPPEPRLGRDARSW